MGGRRLGQRPKREFTSFKESFEEAFPYYLSIGMPPESYWHGDPGLVRFYRAADKASIRRADFLAWLQGQYVYKAISANAQIYRAFSKAKKPADYVPKPYLQLVEDKEREKDRDVRIANGRMAAEDIARRIAHFKDTHGGKEEHV